MKESKKDNNDKTKKVKAKKTDVTDVIWENIKSLLIAIVLAMIIKTSVVEAYKIPTGSMEDTLLVGDFLIANKFVYGARIPFLNWKLPSIREPEQGDIVIFKYPVDKTTNYIKRCVATGGQRVEVIDKVLYVDGKVYENPPHSKFTETRIRTYKGSSQRVNPDNWGPYRVPKDCYFMMGDNRDNSSDSRYWGPVHERYILGEALFIHWSWDTDPNSPKVSAADPLSVPKLFVYNGVHFFERVRWGRLFNIIR